jgi:DNA polymerase-3 subunit delta'
VPLASIIGHAAVITLLRQAVERGRVPQSLLLAGPEGVGKHAIALALAQAVNCRNPTDGDACGVCTNCTRIARGQFSDVTVIGKGDEASIKIRQVRERIIATVGYRPFEGMRRVYILDPADELTIEAQDALLKTLEEPPSAAMLILVTAYPDTLLPTIQSRCRRLRCGLLSEADVLRVLVDRAGVAPAAARALAASSGGSVSRALAGQAGHFDADREAALDLLAAARRGSVVDRLKAATALATNKSKRRDREALYARLAIVSSLIRDLAAIEVQGGVPLANADVEGALLPLAPEFSVDRLTEAFAAVDRAETALGRNASPKIVADWLAVTL